MIETVFHYSGGYCYTASDCDPCLRGGFGGGLLRARGGGGGLGLERAHRLRENDDLRAVRVAVALQLRDRRLRGGAFGGQRVDLLLAIGAQLRKRVGCNGQRVLGAIT